MAEELPQGLHPDNYVPQSPDTLPAYQENGDGYADDYAKRKKERELFNPKNYRGPLQPKELDWLQFVDFDQLEKEVQDEVTSLFGKSSAPQTFMVEEFNELSRTHKLNNDIVPQDATQAVDNASQATDNASETAYNALRAVNNTLQAVDNASQTVDNASQAGEVSEPMDNDSGMSPVLLFIKGSQERPEIPNPGNDESNQQIEETPKRPSEASKQIITQAASSPSWPRLDMNSKEYLEGWLLAVNAWAKADRETFEDLLRWTPRPRIFQGMLEVLERPDADKYQVPEKKRMLRAFRQELQSREIRLEKRYPGVWHPGMFYSEMEDKGLRANEFPWPLDESQCPKWDHATLYEFVECMVAEDIWRNNWLSRHFGTQPDTIVFTTPHTANPNPSNHDHVGTPTPELGIVAPIPARLSDSMPEAVPAELEITAQAPASLSDPVPAALHAEPAISALASTVLSDPAPAAFRAEPGITAPASVNLLDHVSTGSLVNNDAGDDEELEPEIGRSHQGPDLSDAEESIDDEADDIDSEDSGNNSNGGDSNSEDVAERPSAALTNSTGPDLALGNLPAWILDDELIMRNLTTPRPVVEGTDPPLKMALERTLAEVRHYII
ncbi:hypothetical protein B0H67DRAFT_683213 [Lasiosphaeris hirsuta]|uniref:Uncharacterized protein n=1 Tax=Lasiosphaeris hirsuta TaxID=260670 RepID=A0AA40DX04_9PEZI|nr:hypothetical protein B0H67DRAFT_683213 [Lasiosphaeris hirsuta]